MVAYIHQKPRNIIKASVGYGREVIYLSIKSKYFFGYIICPTYPQIHKILLACQQQKTRYELAKRHMNRLPRHSIIVDHQNTISIKYNNCIEQVLNGHYLVYNCSLSYSALSKINLNFVKTFFSFNLTNCTKIYEPFHDHR